MKTHNSERLPAPRSPPAASASLAEPAASAGRPIDGKSEPLRGPALGRGVAAQAIKIAGLDWKLPAIV